MTRTVLHVAQSSETGVAFVVEQHLVPQRAAGWRVALAAPEGTTMSTLARSSGCEFHAWDAGRSPNPLRLPAEVRSLARIVKRVQPDVVHLHSAKAGLAGRLLLRGRLPSVFMPHAWSWHATSGVQRRLALRWERMAARWTDVLCCVSAAEVTEGRQVGIAGDVSVLPHVFSPSALRDSTFATRAEARAALGVDESALLVVCCARLAPQKGQQLLLGAWSQVLDMVPEARLCLVGGGPDEEEVRRRSAAFGESVALAGAQPRATALAWMLASDIVVCPSLYEGRSLVPLEAAALGRVVVTTDVQGAREGAGPDACVVVPLEDADRLAGEMSRLLADPDRRHAGEVEARQWSDANDTGDGPTKTLIELYERLIDSRGRPD